MRDQLVNRCITASALMTLPATITLTFIFAWFAMAPFAVAQDVQSATVVGAVTDPTGAVVPNATVTVTNTATNVTAHATTTT